MGRTPVPMTIPYGSLGPQPTLKACAYCRGTYDGSCCPGCGATLTQPVARSGRFVEGLNGDMIDVTTHSTAMRP
jgi:hypothetical protein